MKVGELNRRITIVIPGVLTPDGIGGFVQGTSTQSDTWCGERQLSMKEQLLFGLETGTASYEFTFRYETGKNITQQTGLIFDGKTLRVISVNDKDKTITKVIANEQTD